MGKIRLSSLLLSLLVLVVGITGAQAQWVPDGMLVSDGSDYHRYAQVVSDGTGGAIIFWYQGIADLYVQRLSVLGHLQWGAGHVPIRTVASGAVGGLCLASDGADGALMGWRDDRSAGPGAYIQKVNSGGTIQWGVDGLDSGFGGSPHILHDGAGGAFVGGTRVGNAIVQRFDAGGTPLWTLPGVDLDDGDRVRLLPDGAGGILVGFDFPWSVRNMVHGDRVDGSGTPLWGFTSVNRSDHEGFFTGDLVPDGEGGAYWVWEQDDYYGATETDLYAQLLDADGNKQWYDNGVYVGSRDSFVSPYARTASDGFGGLLVVYSSSGWDIRLARMGRDGVLLWNVEVCTYFTQKTNGRMAPDGYGGAFVVWEDQRGPAIAETDLYAQHIDKDGTRMWTDDGAAICTQDRDQVNPEIAATGNHGAVIAWEDSRAGDLPEHLYAQFIHADGSIGDPPFEVYSTFPDVNAVDVPLNTSIQATFSGDVTPATLLGGTLIAHGSQTGPHGGSISLIGRTVTLNPDDDFVPGEVVTVTLTDGVESTGGKPLTPVCWSFTTEGDGVHGGFMASRESNVQTYPFSVCPADINQDGVMDLLVTNYLSDTLSFLEGRGGGFFQRPVNHPTHIRPRGVVAGDFDGDGFLDAATANVDGDDVSLFIGDLTGLAYKDSYDTGNNPGSICAADFDGDGHLDLATASLGYDAISILINGGIGNFALPEHYGSGDNPNCITAADLDNDGNIDLMTANTASDDISIFMNDGTGAFEPRVDIPTGDNSVTVHAADLDGDGDLDLVVAANSDAQLVVLFNYGDASFASPVTYPVGAGVYGGLPADVNGDGHLDLIFCSRNENEVRVRLNDGNGGFGSGSRFGVGTGPIALAAADFNNNGSLDLVTANGTSNDVSVLLNNFALSGVEVPEKPTTTSLHPNAPNPFNPTTRIDYAVHQDGHVRLVVYDARGREIATLVDEHQLAQEQSVNWDGRDATGNRVASGVYFYKLFAGDFEETRKMVLVK